VEGFGDGGADEEGAQGGVWVAEMSGGGVGFMWCWMRIGWYGEGDVEDWCVRYGG